MTTTHLGLDEEEEVYEARGGAETRRSPGSRYACGEERDSGGRWMVWGATCVRMAVA